MQHHVALSALTVSRRTERHDEWSFSGRRARRRLGIMWRRAARPAQWSPALAEGHDTVSAAQRMQLQHRS
jgi:hypothetical protein